MSKWQRRFLVLLIVIELFYFSFMMALAYHHGTPVQAAINSGLMVAIWLVATDDD